MMDSEGRFWGLDEEHRRDRDCVVFAPHVDGNKYVFSLHTSCHVLIFRSNPHNVFREFQKHIVQSVLG